MNKQPELTALTKQNLLDAFWQIYCIKRIDKITIRDITMKAGYNRSTFYEYFNDVYDVLEHIENAHLPIIEEFPPVEFISDASQLSMEGFVKMYNEHSKYYIVLLGDNGDPSFLSKVKNNLKPKLKQLLIATGAPDDFELDYLLEYTLSAMIGVLSYWFTQESMPPTERLLKLMNDIMRDGVMNKLSKLYCEKSW